MSYDIYLNDPITGATIEFEEPHQMKGGTYAIGGTTEAHLNITWNYGGHFRRVLGDGGIRSIYQKTGADTIPVLQYAAEQLGDDTDEDYWKPTEGNAKAAILQLLAMAKMRPDGVWEGD